MNRRDVLKSTAVIVGAPASAMAAGIWANNPPGVVFGAREPLDRDRLQKMVKDIQDNNKSMPMLIPQNPEPLVVVRTQRRLTESQLQEKRRDLDAVGQHAGCRIVFVDDCDSASVDGAKYGFTEKAGYYSFSVFCQTNEELREWLPIVSEPFA